MSRNQTIITLGKAVSLLPEGETIHTFRSGGMTLFGTDWERDQIIAALAAASEIHVSRDFARGMHHGLAIIHGGSWLFIETARTNEVLDFLANPTVEA